MAKKVVSKKAKKTPAKKVTSKPAKKAAGKKNKTTKIVVKYDCGFANHLTLRGEGAGLSWHHGTPLKNTSTDEWTFEVMAPDEVFEFKILINDQVFEMGENHKVHSGEKLHLLPKFS